MNYNRSPFNNIVDEEDNERRQRQRYPPSSSGQWATPQTSVSGPSWGSGANSNDAKNPCSVGPLAHFPTSGHYPTGSPMPPGSAYPPSADYRAHPQYTPGPAQAPYPAYQSAYIDARPTYLNQPSNHAMPTQFNTTPGYPSSNYPMPSSAQYPSTAYNSGHQHSAYTPEARHGPTPGGSRSGHGHSPGYPNRQIQLPEPADNLDSSAGKQCSHCHATSTPLWRRDPRTHRTLCNACGLYQHQRQAERPQTLIRVDTEELDVADSDGEYDGPECDNCGTRKTPSWRRNRAGAQVCNACGVYERTNGRPRPLALRNDKIRPRSKHQ